MQTDNVMVKFDELAKQNKMFEAQELLYHSIEQAKSEQDNNALLVFTNEMIGFKRDTSQVEDSYRYAEEALKLCEQMGITNTKPYATTLLNIANAYRAGGRLEDSLTFFQKVLSLYPTMVDSNDMLYAGLYNNISLLYQEMGDFENAREYLLKALPIVKQNENVIFEEAVTYTNLASDCLMLNRSEEAKEYFTNAITLFEGHGVKDVHLAAALAAKGTYEYQKKEYKNAQESFTQALHFVKESVGETDYYRRLLANITACQNAADAEDSSDGMALCRAFYEKYGKAMIAEKFPENVNQIAVGLVGQGSDCFGYDDEISRDHDWGPGFIMWVSDEVYEKIGRQLSEAYNELPKEFMGYTRRETPMGKGRMGVHTINGFYKRILGEENIEINKQNDSKQEGVSNIQISWKNINDEALAECINGKVFTDPEGTFTTIRNELKKGFPQNIQYLKLAESCAHFSQGMQYNFRRMAERKDIVAANLTLAKGCVHAMKILYYVTNEYPPHDKWLFRGIVEKSEFKEEAELIQKIYTGNDIGIKISQIQELNDKLSDLLYQKDFVTLREDYLDAHVHELTVKALFSEQTDEQLVDTIAKAEFEAFDKVRNEGGRASCQNDWYTFYRMRKSQYLTWNRTMLLQYLYDFTDNYQRGRNLIEEKYGRMMESTAPDEYAQIASHFPDISIEKKQIIEAIVQIQVAFMEEFAKEYPTLAGNARTIHTGDDMGFDTSYETYLRGEISTYSDKMLTLYGKFVAGISAEGKNLAKMTMENSVHLYGYENLTEADKAMSQQHQSLE